MLTRGKYWLYTMQARDKGGKEFQPELGLVPTYRLREGDQSVCVVDERES